MSEPVEIDFAAGCIAFLTAVAGVLVTCGVREFFKKRSAEDIFLNETEVNTRIKTALEAQEKECLKNREHCSAMIAKDLNLMTVDLKNSIDNISFAQKVVHDRLKKGDKKFEAMSRECSELTGSVKTLIKMLEKNSGDEAA